MSLMSLLCDNCGEPLIKEGDHFVCRRLILFFSEQNVLLPLPNKLLFL